MRRPDFTQEQRKELETNPNIRKVLKSSIAYTQDFKEKVLFEHIEQGVPCRQIFSNAGIPDWINTVRHGDKCLERWKAAKNNPSTKKQGRPKNTEKDLDEMSIDELKAHIEYLKVENDFLKKLNALETQE